MLRTTRAALGILLCLVVMLISACATTSARRPPSPGAARPSTDMVYIADGYTATSASAQRIIAFRPNGPTTAPMMLPAGLTALDHLQLFVAKSASGFTTLSALDTRTGATIRSFRIPGTYSTTGPGYGDATLSANGQWLALRDLSSGVSGTSIAVVDTRAGALAQTFHLDGDFTLDAISPNAAMLYLIQNLHDAAHHYYVRAYDLRAGQLLQAIIVDKSELDEQQMVGKPLTRLMSRDGAVAYTLYTNVATNKAFVHILPLATGPDDPPFARCIDLPSGQSPSLLRDYTLALSADGSSLFAANAALGLISRIGLHGSGSGVFSDQLDSQSHLTPAPAIASSTMPLYAGAALSADQSTLYIAGPRGIQALDVGTLAPRRTYLDGSAVTSVALGSNGATLYVVAPGQGLLLLALTPGQVTRCATCPAQAPWGIAWVGQ